MRRRPNSRKTAHRPPALNRYGSIQAYQVLLCRARQLGVDRVGIPKGVWQIGNRLYLYADVSRRTNRRGPWKGRRFRPRIIRQVRPLDARHYTPRV